LRTTKACPFWSAKIYCESLKRRSATRFAMPNRRLSAGRRDAIRQLDVFNSAIARPSTVTGADYNQLSTAFFQNVNKVLTGAESGKDAVVQVEQVAKRIVH
jgi:hypothetical protein